MRYELTDHEWAAIKPMLPNKPRGVPRVIDRRVLNGIFSRSRGCRGLDARRCTRRRAASPAARGRTEAPFRTWPARLRAMR